MEELSPSSTREDAPSSSGSVWNDDYVSPTTTTASTTTTTTAATSASGGNAGAGMSCGDGNGNGAPLSRQRSQPQEQQAGKVRFRIPKFNLGSGMEVALSEAANLGSAF